MNLIDGLVRYMSGNGSVNQESAPNSAPTEINWNQEEDLTFVSTTLVYSKPIIFWRRIPSRP